MTSGWRVLCFGIAFLCLAVAAVLDGVGRGGRWSSCLMKGGLAFFVLVFLWDAVALDP